ncbi:M20/M25/M40 family metallo-hydrolase [Roseivirga sp. BDSF3-8]|uniref:M20/M25/M40 family metallo-hydrolase n=1 Tax=Roseivirga sp. BDSF3-8 TaxID=3241598 RepID=UPI00353272A7
MKKLTVFVIILLSSLPACSQERKDSIAYTVDTTSLYRDLRILSADSMAGRQTGTEGNKKARDYIIGRFEEIGLTAYTPNYLQPFSVAPVQRAHSAMDTVQGVNLLGFVQGESDSVIVLSAHYDHVGARNGDIYNGADDNASGVAAMLAIAEYFSANKPLHTMLFAAFDAEEVGLQGAKYFMNSLEVDPDRIVLNVNMDMVSQNRKGELYATGTRYTPSLKNYLTQADEQSPVKLKFGHDGRDGLQDWTTSSDHGPFHKKGIPFIYFGVEDHPYYHKPTDTYEQVPLPFYGDATELILNSLIRLDEGLATGE